MEQTKMTSETGTASGNTGFKFPKIIVETRTDVSRSLKVIGFVAAIILTALSLMVYFSLADVPIKDGFVFLYQGSFGDFYSFVQTLLKATPIMLTGLGVVVAFKARIWNIGAEGQLFAGACMSYLVSTYLGDLHSTLCFILIIIGAFIGGGLYGGFAGFLKTKFELDEVISTVMMNYIIGYFLSYMLVGGPWTEPNTYYAQTARVAANTQFAVLGDSKLHIGFVLGLVLAFGVAILFKKMILGYEIRAYGSNPISSAYKGINKTRLTIFIMILSGGLAGLAGATEVFGVSYRLNASISPGYGFMGIIVAILAGLNPIGVVVASILFGALLTGGLVLQLFAGVSTSVVQAIQATTLIIFLITAAMTRYRFRRIG